ncbi:DUF309 domain-containing protein [Peribacillus cavernae]|uniref:DUF309 domain-containing protein n=1 Tax=Peribacillus cavernae TaxID=1674310 RepID=UPI001FECED3E|nr:DUF309 domain-containing protein [Peribacillus cavernae]MDQ0219046.1 putative metal-dependent hydrolase [Peribacillus cavernae]
MHYPEPYVSYLIHFHGERDYFECHEVLEEYWKEVAPGERGSRWVGLIQIAVSFYHYRRGNFIGALKTMKKAISILEKKSEEINELGIDHLKMLILLNKTKDGIESHRVYHSINLPITDPGLIKQCEDSCKLHGYNWCAESDLANVKLVNRHALRDRTKVTQERKRQLTCKDGTQTRSI